MAVAGSLTYDTKIDKNGFEKGINSLKSSTKGAFSEIKNIVTALGIDKLISSTFNLINGSIDGAISRLDTLNNYPKVMSNLGIAGDKAQKSIDKMSDKLSGLPTTLDAGAMAVQRFTSANNDIDKSTDYFLALNNALLAGGASADIQSTALEQLSQSYAKGKPDMMEWRSIQTAMPAQLNQVAQSFNMTSDELGEALRSGKISMDDFMNKIVELNEKGSGNFQSFEEQAKNSTGGIETSITVAKTQVTKGVADIIKSLDEFLKDEGLGGIGEVISDIGKKAKEILDKLAEKLPEVLKWVAEHKNALEILTGVVISLWGAYEAYKITLLIIKGINIATSIWSTVSAFVQLLPAIKSVKDAMLLLNMAFAINPIALIIGAIVALIAIFVVLWNKCDWFRNFWIGLWEGIKKAFQAAWNAIVGFFTETIPNAFQSLLDKISEIGNNIKTFFENLWNGIVTFFTETIPQWIQNVIDWFANLPYMIGYHIGQLLGNIIQFGANLWNWVTVELPQIIQSVIDWFAQLPERIWEWLVTTAQKIEDWKSDLIDKVKDAISSFIDNAIQTIQELPGKIWNWLITTALKIEEWKSDLKAKAKDAITNLIDSVVEKIKELPDKMIEAGKNIAEGLWNRNKKCKGLAHK